MGIEQILLPIIGGIAQGAGKGIEERRRQEMAVKERQDAKLAETYLSDPELWDTPAAKQFGERYYGKDGWRAQKAAKKFAFYQNKYEVEQAAATGDPFSERKMPVGYMPPEPAEAPESAASPGGILGIISKFLPGADKAMSALGISPGAAQAAGPQMAQAGQLSQPSSTGAPSGPQGYGAPSPIPPPTGGWQPTAAAPATPLTSAAPAVVPVAAPRGSDQAIMQQGRDLGLDVRRVGVVPTTRMVNKADGSVVLSGVDIPGAAPISGQAAAVRKPIQIAENVSVTRNAKGQFSLTFSGKKGESISDPYKLAIAIVNPNGELDMKDPAVLIKIRKVGDDIAAATSVNTQTRGAAAMAALEAEPWYRDAKIAYAAEQAGATTLAGEQAKTQHALLPDARQVDRNQIIDQSIGKNTRYLLAGETVARSQEEREADLLEDNLQRKYRNEPLSTAAVEKLGLLEDISRELQTMQDNFDPKYLGFMKGRGWWRKIQNTMGNREPKEVAFWQAFSNAASANLHEKFGTAVSEGEKESAMEGMIQGTAAPNVFWEQLKGFKASTDARRQTFGELSVKTKGQVAKDLGVKLPTPPETGGAPTAAPSTRTPPINKDKTSKFYGQPMNTKADVPLNDSSATAAPPEVVPIPAGMFKETPTPEEMATGNFAHKLTPEGLKALQDAAKRGDLRKGSVYEYAP